MNKGVQNQEYIYVNSESYIKIHNEVDSLHETIDSLRAQRTIVLTLSLILTSLQLIVYFMKSEKTCLYT